MSEIKAQTYFVSKDVLGELKYVDLHPIDGILKKIESMLPEQDVLFELGCFIPLTSVKQDWERISSYSQSETE